jgi:hypothetical protein
MKRLVWAMALVVVLPISAFPEVKGKGTPPVAVSTVAMQIEQCEKLLAALSVPCHIEADSGSPERDFQHGETGQGRR